MSENTNRQMNNERKGNSGGVSAPDHKDDATTQGMAATEPETAANKTNGNGRDLPPPNSEKLSAKGIERFRAAGTNPEISHHRVVLLRLCRAAALT